MLTRSKTHVDVDSLSDPDDLGFRILRQAIDVVINNEYIEKLKKRARGGAIFNNSGKNDRLRTQSVLRTNSKLYHQLEQLVQNEFPHLTPSDAVVLQSKPGCAAQKVHADYNVFDMKHHNSTIPYSLLLALDEHTRLIVYPGSQRLSEKGNEDHFHQSVVYLSPGDVVFFRGDLLHAGCAYDAKNARVHMYLDSTTHVREKDRTWILEQQAFQLVGRVD
jgi:ectoine hydroxylase-related dioxygenase (phytanoyl-CoA dioxygenase family)